MYGLWQPSIYDCTFSRNSVSSLTSITVGENAGEEIGSNLSNDITLIYIITIIGFMNGFMNSIIKETSYSLASRFLLNLVFNLIDWDNFFPF
jgi:hypothetical protein